MAVQHVDVSLLLSWDFRLDISLILLLAALLYFRGWRRRRAQSRDGGGEASGWRLAAYLIGLLTLALALLSPIDTLQSLLFLMHMVQHLLLTLIAPPLLLLGNPLPAVMWGLPAGARPAAAAPLGRRAPFRRALSWLARPLVSVPIFVVVLLGWHLPAAYGAALQSDLVHDLEHLTFFGAAMLFWWPIVGAAPILRRRLPAFARALILISAMPFTMFLGALLTLAAHPIYPYYLTVPRLWGLSPLDDQRLGGLIMWIPGNLILLLVALILLARGLAQHGAGEGEAVTPPERRGL